MLRKWKKWGKMVENGGNLGKKWEKWGKKEKKSVILCIECCFVTEKSFIFVYIYD